MSEPDCSRCPHFDSKAQPTDSEHRRIRCLLRGLDMTRPSSDRVWCANHPASDPVGGAPPVGPVVACPRAGGPTAIVAAGAAPRADRCDLLALFDAFPAALHDPAWVGRKGLLCAAIRDLFDHRDEAGAPLFHRILAEVQWWPHPDPERLHPPGSAAIASYRCLIELAIGSLYGLAALEGDRSYPEIAPFVAAGLPSQEAETHPIFLIRLAAIGCLQAVDGPGRLELLRRGLGDPNQLVQQRAREVLAAVKAPPPPADWTLPEGSPFVWLRSRQPFGIGPCWIAPLVPLPVLRERMEDIRSRGAVAAVDVLEALPAFLARFPDCPHNPAYWELVNLNPVEDWRPGRRTIEA